LPLLAVALLVGSVAAFTWTEKVKLDRSPIGAPRFQRQLSPSCGCRHASAHLSFLLRRTDRLNVAVVDENERLVRTLAADVERRRGRVKLEWDGRDSAGRIVADADYRLRVRLERTGQEIVIPVTVKVDTQPPDVQLLGLSATTLSPGDSGITLRYDATEYGTPILLVDRRVAVRGAGQDAGPSALTWEGTRRSRRVRAGTHELALVVVDRAGNRSEPTEPVTVVVR
jgi:FlgD Ig-like domain